VLIDSLESANGIVPSTTVPGGTWFEYDDGTSGATQLPAPNGSGTLLPTGNSPVVTHFISSKYAMETHGSGFTSYGAGIGFNMNDLASQTPHRQVFDAGNYTGFIFFAKIGSTQTMPPQVRFNVPTAQTDPQGNICSSCNDHFGAWLSAPLTTVSTTWQEYVVPFSSLSQQHFGTPATWDPHQIYGCQWQVPEGMTFDFWIDDIYFITP
jgi:hypothetical protein